MRRIVELAFMSVLTFFFGLVVIASLPFLMISFIGRTMLESMGDVG